MSRKAIAVALALLLTGCLAGIWRCPPCRNHKRLDGEPCPTVDESDPTCEKILDACNCCYMCAIKLGERCSYFEPCEQGTKCTRPDLPPPVPVTSWDFYGVCKVQPTQTPTVNHGNNQREPTNSLLQPIEGRSWLLA